MKVVLLLAIFIYFFIDNVISNRKEKLNKKNKAKKKKNKYINYCEDLSDDSDSYDCGHNRILELFFGISTDYDDNGDDYYDDSCDDSIDFDFD